MIPTKYFIVKEMKVLSNSEPLSAYLAREALNVVGVLRGSHYEFKRGYWLVTCGTNTGNAKQSTKKINQLINQSINQSISQSVTQLVSQSVRQSVSQSAYSICVTNTVAGPAQSVKCLTAEREVVGSIPGAGPILRVLK